MVAQPSKPRVLRKEAKLRDVAQKVRESFDPNTNTKNSIHQGKELRLINLGCFITFMLHHTTPAHVWLGSFSSLFIVCNTMSMTRLICSFVSQ